jgi:membrane fusion protein, multidrug efflux system
MSVLKKLILPGAILVLGLLVMQALKAQKKESPKRVPVKALANLRVVQVTMLNETPSIKGYGRIQAKDRVTLVSEVSGKVLFTGFKLRQGVAFRQGQVLAYIDNEVAKNQLKMQVSNLMNGLSSMLPDMKLDMPQESAKWEAFFGELSFENIPDLPNVDSSKEKLYLTRYNIFSLYFTAANQKLAVRKHVLTAPFNGVVATSNVYPGNMAGAGTPLATLVRNDIYEVNIPLSVSEASLVKPGTVATVKVSGSTGEYSGKVVRISDVMDVANQTMHAVIELRRDKHGVITDGAYAELSSKGKPLQNVFPLPRNALLRGEYAVVIQDIEQDSISQKGIVQLRQIELAHTGRDTVFVAAGLQNGELVVNEPTQGVIDGMMVRIRKQPQLEE